jgi:hypothetical protein
VGTLPEQRPLTDRQRGVWLWMLRYQREHNRPPTACELAGFVTGRPSKRRPTSALCHLEALARRGHVVRRGDGSARGWLAVLPPGVVELVETPDGWVLACGGGSTTLPTRDEAREAYRLLGLALGEG